MALNLNDFLGGNVPTSLINALIAGVRVPYNGFLNSTVAVSNAALTLTTSYQDIPNCTYTFTITGGNAFALVTANILWACTVASATDFFQATCLADGVDQGGNGTVVESTVSTFNFRSGSQTWKVPLAAGGRTMKLQAKKSGATPSGTTSNPHTTMAVLIFDLP